MDEIANGIPQEIHGELSVKLRRSALIAVLTATLLLFTLTACTNNMAEKSNPSKSDPVSSDIDKGVETVPVNLINSSGNTVQDRIRVPEDFTRIEADDASFGHYLRTLPLKPDGSELKLFNGETKNTDSYAAILDIDVGDRDLQQCADAIIRLRAEYLYGCRLYEKIHFNFTNGFKADFSTWMNGNSIKVDGNEARWVRNAFATSDYSSFRKYLDMVFAYAGTLSLSKEMTGIPLEEMDIGDVFIKGATPGHGVIILDMARNEKTGEKLFILAQSYMPAQDIHILRNPGNDEISPWYQADFDNTLVTPDWEFGKDQLMRFG